MDPILLLTIAIAALLAMWAEVSSSRSIREFNRLASHIEKEVSSVSKLADEFDSISSEIVEKLDSLDNLISDKDYVDLREQMSLLNSEKSNDEYGATAFRGKVVNVEVSRGAAVADPRADARKEAIRIIAEYGRGAAVADPRADARKEANRIIAEYEESLYIKEREYNYHNIFAESIEEAYLEYGLINYRVNMNEWCDDLNTLPCRISKRPILGRTRSKPTVKQRVVNVGLGNTITPKKVSSVEPFFGLKLANGCN